MPTLTASTIAAIKANPVLIGQFADHLGLRPATIELYLRTGKLRKLSTPAATAFLRRKLKLPKSVAIINETDNN